MMIVFQTPQYGALLVDNMIDIDGEITDDIELAMRVVCSHATTLGTEWLCMCACERCGVLLEVKPGMRLEAIDAQCQ